MVKTTTTMLTKTRLDGISKILSKKKILFPDEKYPEFLKAFEEAFTSEYGHAFKAADYIYSWMPSTVEKLMEVFSEAEVGGVCSRYMSALYDIAANNIGWSGYYTYITALLKAGVRVFPSYKTAVAIATDDMHAAAVNIQSEINTGILVEKYSQ